MTRPWCTRGVISIIQVSVTTNSTEPTSPPRNRIANHAMIDCVLMRAKMSKISKATPPRRRLRASMFLIDHGTAKEPIIIPAGAAMANPPISVLLTLRASRINDSSGVNRLIVIP